MASKYPYSVLVEEPYQDSNPEIGNEISSDSGSFPTSSRPTVRLSDALKNKRAEESLWERERSETDETNKDQTRQRSSSTQKLARVSEPFQNEDKALLLTTGNAKSAKHYKKYLLDNWENLTKGLTTLRLLIICGVHGDIAGGIGDDANNVKDFQKLMVSRLAGLIR